MEEFLDINKEDFFFVLSLLKNVFLLIIVVDLVKEVIVNVRERDEVEVRKRRDEKVKVKWI